MQFAKPGGGFRWAVSKKAKAQLLEILNSAPRLEPYWNALRDRLVHTGHREGTKITALPQKNAFVFSMELDDLPTVQLVYTILGDTLTVQSVRTVE
jgi:hypothetical protein